MKLKTIIYLLPVLLCAQAHAQFDHLNINLLGQFSDSTVQAEPVYGVKYQSCWGWVDSLGNEYAILGSSAGTYIVNVTNPSNPVQCDYVPTRRNDCIWHEYKTYQNYLYIISDDGGNNSFQIADLSYLPDSVHLVYDSTDIFVHSHTLFIDGNKLYVASVSTFSSFYSMCVYSLSNPAYPVLLRELNQDYPLISSIHDIFVSHDTVYASAGYDGLQIFHFDTLSNTFNLLGSLPGNPNNYNHSSCLSKDYTKLYVCEEVPDGRPIQIVDVTNIHSPLLVDTFNTNPGNTPHNPYLKDSLLIVAAYQDGVYIYDVSNPVTPVLKGYFDTYPTNPPGVYFSPAYKGAWAAYADLPSKTLLVSDMQLGLFCLDISGISEVKNIFQDNIKIFPNPAHDYLRITNAHDAEIEFIDLTGKVCLRKTILNDHFKIDVSGLRPGFYTLILRENERTIVKKLIKR